MELNEIKENLYRALTALILVVFGIRFLDQPLATWIADFSSAYAPRLKASDMPDLLFITCVMLTSLSWMLYFYLVRLSTHDRRAFFCRVTGTALPFSFGVKIFLKWVFGRTETRIWLSDPSLYGFHWFAGAEGFLGFPSGHMLVLTPVLWALWHCYPRYRLYCGMIWLCLGAALIATEYHFLSDVLAGAYIGALICQTVAKLDKLASWRFARASM